MSSEPSFVRPDSGFDFVGMENLHNDIYPAIDATQNQKLKQSGKVILITGAGRGIGRAIALQYARADAATLILCARTASELDEVDRAIKKKEVLSVTDGAAVKQLAEKVSKEQRRLDVLINNAGLSREWEPLAATDPEDYWQVLEVNVKGPLLLLHAFLPLLVDTAETQKSHVSVVNVTSTGSVTVSPGGSSYAIAKLALQRMSEFVGVEYGDKGLNVVGLHPGGVMTKLAEKIKEIKDYLIDTPELCGGFVVWLSAEDRAWLNGRYVSATWDVSTLEDMKEDIVEGNKLKMKLVV
ncbi:putative oxidoreductase ucpA [Lizonia empirigonia]|nr:putative oxidoreductase ucpA [Lizonia empirigonia]